MQLISCMDMQCHILEWFCTDKSSISESMKSWNKNTPALTIVPLREMFCQTLQIHFLEAVRCFLKKRMQRKDEC